MISISDLTRPDFSTKILNPILSSMDDLIYPLNTYTGFNLAKKNYASLKSFSATNPSSSCGVHLYANKISELTSEEVNLAESWLAAQAFNYSYVYFGSKSSFRNYSFSDFLPTAFDFLYAYLIANNYIKQIGSGQGSAILLNSTLFSEPFTIPVQESVDQMSQTFESFLRNFNSLKSDNEYLYNIILQKNESINILTRKIEELEHKSYLDSRMTWR